MQYIKVKAQKWNDYFIKQDVYDFPDWSVEELMVHMQSWDVPGTKYFGKSWDEIMELESKISGARNEASYKPFMDQFRSEIARRDAGAKQPEWDWKGNDRPTRKSNQKTRKQLYEEEQQRIADEDAKNQARLDEADDSKAQEAPETPGEGVESFKTVEDFQHLSASAKNEILESWQRRIRRVSKIRSLLMGKEISILQAKPRRQ